MMSVVCAMCTALVFVGAAAAVVSAHNDVAALIGRWEGAEAARQAGAHGAGAGGGFCAMEALTAHLAARKRIVRDAAVVARNECLNLQCDDPVVRDRTPVDRVRVRVVAHILNDAISKSLLEKEMRDVRNDFLQYNIELDVTVQATSDDFGTGKPDQKCMPSMADPEWYDKLLAMYARHHTPTATDLYFGCADPDLGLGGIGYFPWMDDPTGPGAGTWVNTQLVADHQGVTQHELGHTFGLWHAFHGVSEIPSCAPDSDTCGRVCCEYPHGGSTNTSDPANLLGDLCSDTMSTPVHYICESPDGDSCDEQPWGNVNYRNYMSYAMRTVDGDPHFCFNHFSVQQHRRMHCYLRDQLKVWTNKN